MLSPAVPYLMVLINWIIYCYWSDINQTHLSLYLIVFAIPLVKLNINLVVSTYAILGCYVYKPHAQSQMTYQDSR